jgi:hypothetical protein
MPPFFPRRRGIGCTPCALSPGGTEPLVQSSACRCMYVHGTLWSYPREFNQMLLRPRQMLAAEAGDITPNPFSWTRRGTPLGRRSFAIDNPAPAL